MNPAAYRKKMEKQVRAAARNMKKHAAAFRKASTAKKRQRALAGVGQLEEARDLALARRLAANPEEPTRLRVAAIAQLTPLLADGKTTLKLLIDQLGNPDEPAAVRGAALMMLKAAAFHSSALQSLRPRYIESLRAAAEATNPTLRQRALGVLARERDAPTLNKLENGLRNPAKALVSPEKALQLLSYDPKRDIQDVLVQMVKKPPTPEAQQQALRNLAAQGGSRRILENVLKNKKESKEARVIAMAGLQSLAPLRATDLVENIVADPKENESLREAGLVAATTFGPRMSSEKLRKGAAQLQKSAKQPSTRRVAARYLAKPSE
jgi:hypothetical protein